MSQLFIQNTKTSSQPAKRTDRRVQKTKSALYEALIQLIHTQSVMEVSVSNLCELANVNRSSFYKYYSTPSDILREREAQIFQSFYEHWQKGNARSVHDAILQQLYEVQNEQEFCRLMFGPNGLPGFLENLTLNLQKQCVENFKTQNPALSTSQAEYLFIFWSRGAQGVVEQWVKNGCKQAPEEVADMVTQVSLYGMNSYQLGRL